MLRERFAHRYHNSTLFGMYPRGRRGESSRRGEGIGYSLDRVGTASRKSVSAKLVDAEGAPLVETELLPAMIRVLRMVQVLSATTKIFVQVLLINILTKQIFQPLYKGPLQRLLLNLCAHGETRTALVKIMMDMLMLDTRKSVSQLNATEPMYRLYACQSSVMYSRPQSFDGKASNFIGLSLDSSLYQVIFFMECFPLVVHSMRSQLYESWTIILYIRFF